MEMMSSGAILSAIAVLTLGLDVYALRRVFISPFYNTGQRYAQAAIILCIPLAGAYVTIYMARDSVQMFQKPPMDFVTDIDPMSSDVEMHAHD